MREQLVEVIPIQELMRPLKPRIPLWRRAETRGGALLALYLLSPLLALGQQWGPEPVSRYGRVGPDLGLLAMGAVNLEADRITLPPSRDSTATVLTATLGWMFPVRSVQSGNWLIMTANPGVPYLHGSTRGCWNGPMARFSIGWASRKKHHWRTNSVGLLLSYGQTDSFRAAHRDNFRGTNNPGLGSYQIQQLDRFRIVPYWEQSIPKRLGRHLEGVFYWSAGISIAYDHLTVSRWKAPYGTSATPFEEWNWKAFAYATFGVRPFWILKRQRKYW